MKRKKQTTIEQYEGEKKYVKSKVKTLEKLNSRTIKNCAKH